MRIMMIQPNYHSGGAEIAGNWPPSWVPYVGGALKKAGFEDIRFVDAMTNYIPDDILAGIKEYKVKFFILADEEPTITKPRFMALCNELIERKLDVHWGINTRVTDILRDEKELALYRKAGLVHVSLGTEAAAQLNLNLFRKETTIEDNKKAVRLLRENGMVAEVQYIMGLENETLETLEETYCMARDWKADMTNWNMFTPWPFSELFEDLEDIAEQLEITEGMVKTHLGNVFNRLSIGGLRVGVG